MRIRVTSGKTDDPEKMVFPGAVFCKQVQPGAKGFVIAIGWWDYHVSFIFAWPRNNARALEHTGQDGRGE